jgi:hypothetical protein
MFHEFWTLSLRSKNDGLPLLTAAPLSNPYRSVEHNSLDKSEWLESSGTDTSCRYYFSFNKR